MLYRAIHTTGYTYASPVSHCLTEARLTPRTLPNQSLRNFDLRIDPAPASIDRRKDYFGNDIVSFAVLEPHRKFSIVASSLVELEPAPAPLAASELEAEQFLWESPYVPYVEQLADYGRENETIAGLMRQVHRDFKYAPKSTSIETPLADVLRQRKGVCQDFAHVMIGALRARGIPARYVSGYLRGDADFQGAQASHAWVSVYIPNQGWQDFDPTNNVIPSASHITLAWGRDYGDVTPVRGITLGGGEHTMEVDVRVSPAPSSSG